MSAGDDAVGLEQLEEDADEIALHNARRSTGSMSAMSGAKGMLYMEYRFVLLFLTSVYYLLDINNLTLSANLSGVGEFPFWDY